MRGLPRGGDTSVIQRGVKAGVQLWRQPFVRFLFVGGLNTAFGYGVYGVLWLLGVPVELALLIAFVLGVLFNFRTTGVVVFGSRSVRRLRRFVLVYVPLYVVNVLLLRWLCAAGLGALVAQALCLPPVTVATYLGLKFLVFRGAAGTMTACARN